MQQILDYNGLYSEYIDKFQQSVEYEQEAIANGTIPGPLLKTRSFVEYNEL